MRGEFLGKGGFATCYRLTDPESGKIFAAKIIEKKNLLRKRAAEKLSQEIKIHKELNHENIVDFKHFFEDAYDVYMLMELCEN